MSAATTHPGPRDVRSFASDRSGAVMLMAVFMAVFLTGMLWYAIGIGNAVIYRETMLDGADATAYAAAVYDARGMNIIAMINLIMAAVMAVLVAIKIVQLLVIAANVISCALCIIGVGCPVCAVTSEWEEPIESAVQDVQNVVNEVEPALNKASTIVAIAMPWIAEVRSVAMAGSYGPTVHGGLTVAYAQLPGSGASSVFGGGDSQQQPPVHHVACRDGTQSPTCTWEGGNSTGSTTKSGQPNRSGCCSSHGGILGEGTAVQSEGTSSAGGTGRIGLPVQDDDPAVLCKAAATILDDLIHDTVGKIPLLGGIFNFVGGLMTQLVSSMPSYFCGGGSPTDIQGAVGSALQQAGLNPATACTQQNIDKHNAQCASTTCPQSNPQCCVHYGSVAACQQDLKNKTAAADSANDQNSQSSSTGNQATKKIADGAKMGDDDFAVFSIVWSELGSGPDRGVDLAAWGKAKTPPPTFLTKISYAKAEFYYDVGIGAFTFQNNDNPQQIPDDAIWNMRWRARLRRMHDPIPQIGSSLASAINDRLDSLGGDIPIPGLAQEAQQVLGPIESWVTSTGSTIDQDISQQVGSWLGVGTFAVVH